MYMAAIYSKVRVNLWSTQDIFEGFKHILAFLSKKTVTKTDLGLCVICSIH